MIATIEQEIVIDAPVDVVWRTVTDPEHVARWFADEVDVLPAPGHDGSVTFAGGDGPRTTVQVSVRSVEPARSFSYRWQHPAGAAARSGNSTLVVFTLTPAGTGTRLRVVESDLDAMGWTPPEHDAFVAEHTRGWATLLDRLRDHLAGHPAAGHP